MFRVIFLSFFLLTVAAPQVVFAQNGDDKPTQILPEDDRSREDIQPKSAQDPTIVDVPLIQDRSNNAGDSSFVIGAVQVEGTSLLSQADFSETIEPFIGRRAAESELQALATAVANHSRDNGYIFATAIIPAQSIKMGILRVRLDEGTIDDVKIKGTDNRYAKRLLRNLVGRPGKKNEVERAILQAGDFPGVSIDKTRFYRKNGKGILAITASDRPHAIHITVDNYGSSRIGPVRTRLELDWNSVFGESDWLNSQVLFTPANLNQLTFVSTRYSNIFTDDGKQFSITGGAGRTRSIDKINSVRSQGRSRYVSMKVGQPVVRSMDTSLWFHIEGAFLEMDRNYSDARLRRDDLATVAALATLQARVAGGRLIGGLTVTQGLDILGATRATDSDKSRTDGSGKFTKGELWLNWNRKLGNGFSIRSTVNGQLASRPLLSSQEIDLGGPRIGRGFDYSERSGDQGITGMVELRRYFDQPTKNISWAQVYTFADGGYIDNLKDGFGGGTLMSAGAGVRAGKGKLELALEMAVPVKGSRYESGNKSPQINFAIGMSF